ncbi:MAG: repair protein SbcC/Rad50 [Thermoleophilaceae bacterium]|jgi:exonuclease SbcC|nr:repair protein SbcC/Rad50 [Thermoleophilaceae bacterium]
MKLLHLKGHNFRSFAEFELDFNAPGLYSITGPNGAGKSSIFGAIEWALFGGKRGPGSVAVGRHGADGDCRVEVEFEVGGRVFKVVRIDGSDAWLIDIATGKELARGLTDTSHEVAVQLGLTQNMFCGTFYARQKEVQALSSSKSLAERCDQLERLLGIEHLRVAADLAARDAREQKGIIDGVSEDAPDVNELRAEVERCEREAQQAAPAVSDLEAKVTELKSQVKSAMARIEALTKQVSEHSSRSLAAEQAVGELARERTVRDNLRQRLEAANAAKGELAELAPVAARADEVTALEREMDQRRRNHEVIEGLRAKERTALEELAKATDALAELGDPPAPSDDPAKKLSAAQQKLNELGEQLRGAAEVRQKADDAARVARERLTRAKAKADAERELEALAESEAQVHRTRERWQELRDQRADLQAQLNHDIKHRHALSGVGDTGTGICPTCKRPLEGTLGDLLAEFEAAIDGREAAIKRIAGEMEQVAAIGKQHRAGAERAQQLRAQLASLVDVGDRKQLEAAAEQTASSARTACDRERDLDTSYRTLADQVPNLRTAAEQAVHAAAKRAEALERKHRAAHEAANYSEQRSQIGANGYDSAAHAELKTDLDRTQKAVRRSAALRDNADAVQLLEGRLASQQPLVDELAERVERLHERAVEVEPEADAQENAVAERQRLDDELEAAQRALDEAKQQASIESAAVTAARARLEDGRKILRRVERERKEYELRAAVARALADYREHASQRARPELECQASHLLKQVTGSMYPVIRLTEGYLLEVADAGRFHPLKRFSGGEQDLAALCLRLALSLTLARQRGAEQGFVILDEVFGSQDSDRRRVLLQQLGDLAENAEFQQIFVISHTDDVREHCRLHIEVSRENGISVAGGPTTGR